MNHQFQGWDAVASELSKITGGNREIGRDRDGRPICLRDGQAASVRELAKRLPQNGVIIADEVGMGKTLIAVVVARAVIAAGGRVAILAPPGLGYQWNDELQNAGVDAPPILRSLRQYLQAWEIRGKDAPWFAKPVLLVSHSFTNWRLGKKATPWRWTLLPEMYAQWRRVSGIKLPRSSDKKKYSEWNTYKNLRKKWPEVKWPETTSSEESLRLATIQAAFSVTIHVKNKEGCQLERTLLDNLITATPWPGALTAEAYERDAHLRPCLESAIGLGMGVFDLVIIDEAHKSRGQESGLNRLRNEVVLQSENARCLAMTATPVELDTTQWTQMLERIGVDEGERIEATTAIAQYVQAIASVRQCPSDPEIREKYKESARLFWQALSPFVLRRDKRQEPSVVRFQQISGKNHHAYRREQEILVDTAQLNLQWKQAVCAAESLSFVTRQSDQTGAKRLRLTLGNGHGIAALIDQLNRDAKDDRKQTEADDTPETASQSVAAPEPHADKRLLRAAWWQQVMIQPFAANRSALFDHPAILAAVEAIENVCRQDEKVLVFGRFTRPLRALVQLLNAREMLRCVDGNRLWPQSKVHENDEWEAVLAAHRQLQRQGEVKRELLNKTLDKQYKVLENQRRAIRERLVDTIEKGFETRQPDDRVRALFDAFKKTNAKSQDSDEYSLVVVARAIQELIGPNIDQADPPDFAQAFIDLVAASCDRDEGDTNGDGELDSREASVLWIDLTGRLQEEYSRSEGGYARLMYGETKPATRRFLQLAFNRKQGHPKVLVAQSVVGREGLNLHKACRTVVLLHPEWNPGVVEQQIGRVDRIGSLWEEKLSQVVADKPETGDLPRIDIHPVVFRGTYDEKNWRVLRDRWDDLRAQLHGIVISSHVAEKLMHAEELINEINGAAPNFSPGFSHVTHKEDEL